MRDLSLTLFAHSAGGPLERGVINLHMIIWKFIIIHFTAVDLNNTRFEPDDIWKNALRRYTSRVERLKLKARKDITRKGDSSLVKWNQYNLEVEPFGSFNDRGWFAYHREMEAVLIKLELIKPQTYIPHHKTQQRD